MLAHLTIGTLTGLVAAIAAGIAGFGVLGIFLVYSAVGTMALLGSAAWTIAREDDAEPCLAVAQ